jgi:DNA-binding NarL/FixJ family response regulator
LWQSGEFAPGGGEAASADHEGHTTKEIAGKLNLSVKTAETHRTQLMQRLDIHDVAGLVLYAVRLGLIHPGS